MIALMYLALNIFIFIVLYPVSQHSLDSLNFCDNSAGYFIFTLILVVTVNIAGFATTNFLDERNGTE